MSGHTAIENGKIDDIINYLCTILSDYSSVLLFKHDYYKKYSPDFLASKYLNLIEHEIISKS